MTAELLVERFRPKTIDDLLITPDIKQMILGWLSQDTIGNLLLHGTPGIGKTSLAKIIASTLDCDVLYVNCSVKNKLSTIKEEVLDFCEMESITGLKIIILDEFDSFREAGVNSPQEALRNPIEKDTDDTRFILTCNHAHRITEAIRSRCLLIEPRFELKDVVQRVVQILDQEKITYTPEHLKLFMQEVVKRSFPDMRAIVKILEAWTITGVMAPVAIDMSGSFDEIISFIDTNIKKPLEIRKYIIKNELLFSGNYQKLTSLLFKHFGEKGNPSAMLITADSMRYYPVVLDQEVEFNSMIIKLSQL